MADNIFIGRTEQAGYLRDNFFVEEPGHSFCCALTGLNGIGKTTLENYLANEFKEKLKKKQEKMYFMSAIVLWRRTHFLWSFWRSIIKQLARQIGEAVLKAAPGMEDGGIKDTLIKEILKCYAFFEDAANADSDTDDIKDTVQNLFLNYTDLGIQILLVVDEFDLMMHVYPGEQKEDFDSEGISFYQFLFSLTTKASDNYNLSIMLISRRQPKTIAYDLAGSNFEDAFPSDDTVLRGFNDAELEEYFATYAELSCGELTEQEKKGVLYFCGRHPGLLMGMRDRLKYTKREGELDIARAFVEKQLIKVYRRMVELMQDEYVDKEHTRSCVNAFAQAYIGPAYDETLKDDITKVYHRGFLNWIGVDGKSLYELLGLDDKQAVDNYEPLSVHFEEYFENVVYPTIKDNVGELLSHTELAVRGMILEELQKQFPDSYEEILKKYAPKKDGYLESLKNQALKNNAAARNLSFTKLDVMAFIDYSNLIRDYWQYMRQRLGSYATKDALKEDFFFLNGSRNCYAHNNAKILSAQNVANLEEICKKICKDIEEGTKPQEEAAQTVIGADEVVQASELQSTSAVAAVENNQESAAAETQTTAQSPTVEELLRKRRVIFCCVRKSKNETYQGNVKGTSYQVSLSKKSSAALVNVMQTEFEVSLTNWNSGQERFYAEV